MVLVTRSQILKRTYPRVKNNYLCHDKGVQLNHVGPGKTPKERIWQAEFACS